MEEIQGQLEVKKVSWFHQPWAMFFVFFSFFVGVALGVTGSKLYFDHKLDMAVKMDRIMINAVDKDGKRANLVYDLTLYDKSNCQPTELKVK